MQQKGSYGDRRGEGRQLRIRSEGRPAKFWNSSSRTKQISHLQRSLSVLLWISDMYDVIHRNDISAFLCVHSGNWWNILENSRWIGLGYEYLGESPQLVT